MKQELEEYKSKATKTLQTKDRLIASLKENAAASTDPSKSSGENSMSNLNQIEIEELKSEKEHLKEELNTKATSLEMIRSEMMV